MNVHGGKTYFIYLDLVFMVHPLLAVAESEWGVGTAPEVRRVSALALLNI